MKRKIYWTKSERIAVFNRLVDVFAKRPRAKKMDAILSAQLILPKERRRQFSSSTASHESDFIESARIAAHNPLTNTGAITVRQELGSVAQKPTTEVVLMLDNVAEAISKEIINRIHANLADAIVKTINQGASGTATD